MQSARAKVGPLETNGAICLLFGVRTQNYGYISSVSTFLPSSIFMEGRGMRNVGEKSMSVDNKCASGWSMKKMPFHPIDPP